MILIVLSEVTGGTVDICVTRSVMNSKITYLILLIGVEIASGGLGPTMGPYDIEIERLEKCEDEGSRKIVFATRITSVGKGKYLYNENFTLGVPADENTKAVLEVQKWGNGGWRKNSIQYTVKNCQDLWKKIGEQVLEVMQYSHSNVSQCPIPAGSYKVDNWPIALKLDKVLPAIEYGKYRGIIKMLYKKEFVGCIMGIVNMVPKT